MFRNLISPVVLLLAFAPALSGQQAWSLQECVDYATRNNLSIKQAQAQIRGAELTLKQSRFSRLPSLNSTVSGGTQFGRTIDPTTNSFDNRQIGFNSYGLNFGVTAFAGNRINNSIRQGQLELTASKLDAAQIGNDISLNVATAYLNVLLSEEQLELARQRIGQSRFQLEQTEKLINAGARAANERLNALSQVALDEQALIQAENALELNYVTLKQLLQLDLSLEFKIQKPEITIPADANPDGFAPLEVFSAALSRQPNIQAGDKRMESAVTGVQIAKAAYLPTLNFFGGMTTNFSSASRKVDGYLTQNFKQTVLLNGQQVVFEVPQQVPLLSENPYFNQLNQNFGQNLGVSMSIPIYNNHRNRVNVERAQLNVINREIVNEQLRQQLKTSIDRAIADARAAKRSYDAATTAVEASSASFRNAQTRYDVGAVNALELQTARNAMEQAKIDLVRARYQYIFNLKLVEFYQGKPLTLN